MLLSKFRDVEIVLSLLDKPLSIENHSKVSKYLFVKEINFNDVSFSYANGKTILDKINFSIKKGQTIGFIGRTGSGKSTTLKTCVQHLRLKFYKRGGFAKVELTSYTGVAAFNIGFGARTACSAFQIFPNAAWKRELEGNALRNLEDTWDNVVLLIVDEVSFIGRALFARMHFRLQQAKRLYFTERSIDPAAKLFGDISIILVGDFGQLEPIDDCSMCYTERNWAT